MIDIKHRVSQASQRILVPVMQALQDLQHQVQQLNERQMDLQRELHDLKKRVENTGTFQISKYEVMTKIFSGAKMYLDPRDIALVPHLVLDGDWERDITHAWLKVLRDGDTVLDIGANFGYFSVLAAQQTNRNAKVILFEANPSLIPYLTKTMDVNSFERCTTIENLAVSDKPGTAKLNVLKDYISSSSLHTVGKINSFNKNKQEVALTVSVPTVTIDDYCEKHKIESVDVIKMDIEGYEEKAYHGMRKVIRNSKRATLFLEFTKDAYEDPKGFYEQMLSDFGNVYVIDETGSIALPKSNKYEDIILGSSNWTMPIFSKNKDLATR